MAPAARELLHVVVTDGGSLPRRIAVNACGLAPAKAAAVIDELRAARLVRVGEEVIEPYHDRVREALARRLSSAERTALHIVLARSLDDADAPPERLAHHWEGAGETERAARCAEAAATRAASALAFDRAAEWLAMALRLGTHDGAHRRALLLARADALTQAGRPRDAGLAFLEAAQTGEPSDIERRDLRRRAAERLLSGGYISEGLEVAREMVAEVGLPWPASRAAALRMFMWNGLRVGACRLKWRTRSESDIPAEQLLRLDTSWSATLGLSMADSIRGTAFAMHTARMTLAAGEPRRIACALSAAAFAAAGLNHKRKLRRLTSAIARAAAETDAPEAHCYVALADAARAYFIANDWPGTREIAVRGAKMWASAGRGHTWEVDLFDQFVGWALQTSGDHRTAADHAERVLRAARRRGDRFIEVGFRAQFPQRYLLDDNPEDGIRDVDDAIASWPVPDDLDPIGNPFYWGWRTRTMLSLYADRADADADVILDGCRRLEGSLLWLAPVVRLDVAMWSGAWALARAAEAKRNGNGSELRAHLAYARRRAKLIAASPFPARAGILHGFRAVLAHLDGNDTAAIDELRATLSAFETSHAIGGAMAARWQLGRLVGGDEGAALIKTASTWLQSIDAVRPERIVALGIPGIGD